LKNLIREGETVTSFDFIKKRKYEILKLSFEKKVRLNLNEDDP